MFFSFVIDGFSRRIVGWQFAGHMRTDLVADALRLALTRREHGADVELIHHSDAGSQYTSFAFNQVLDDHGVLASIGSVGDAYDNAMAESFVDSFKTELIADRVWRTPPTARARDRRMGRLVQPRAPARVPQRHPTSGVRSPTRSADQDVHPHHQDLETSNHGVRGTVKMHRGVRVRSDRP